MTPVSVDGPLSFLTPVFTGRDSWVVSTACEQLNTANTGVISLDICDHEPYSPVDTGLVFVQLFCSYSASVCHVLTMETPDPRAQETG